MAKRVYGLVCMTLIVWKASAQRAFPRPDTIAPIAIKTVPSDFRISRMPLFCRAELRLQKLTGKNIYIRLGSKQYVDYLEQKRKDF